MKIILLMMLSLSVLAGCANAPDQKRALNETQTQTERKTILETDRYIAKEFNHRRPYILGDRAKNQNPEFDHRIANEAERVYNVYRAVVLRQGQDMIIGLKTKADPLQPHDETVERVRDRLLKTERELHDYNLYFTHDETLHDQIVRARVQAEKSERKDEDQTYEPHFSRILQQIKNSNR